MKKILFIILFLPILAQAQTKITTYSVITDTLRGLNAKNIHVVDTFVFTNASRIWKAPDFGESIVTGNILYGGTTNVVGGAMRNSTLLNFDSTNKTFGVGLVVGSHSATGHFRGSSAVTGSVMKLQNSTPTTLFDLLNTGAGTFSNPSGAVLAWGANSAPTVTIGTAGTVQAQLFINGASSSSSLISGLTSAGTYAFYMNCMGGGYIGTPIAAGGLTTNHGLKFAAQANGSAVTSVAVNGVFINPLIAAGANDQVLSALSVQPSSFSLGGTTGTVSQIVDFKNVAGTSIFKISDAGAITLAGALTSSATIKATQFIGGTGFATSATITMTTERTHLVTSGASTTTVNFPAGSEGLEITIINQKVGSITVTAHNDFTGASQTTQAAQSSVGYIYINGGWNRR